MTNLKRTGLYQAHVNANARIVPFAGWEMPVQYTSIIEEHLAVRKKAGLFDVSHMGEVFFSGKDALLNVQNLITNDVSNVKPNRIVYSGLLYPHGGFVDDLLVYKFSDT
ncbi:glycine cleavage system aminomethyltransferase GcvT, partial [bacterium]|nr:glycine cleavage system aminomethyltransferase GcvT [candidate division CSSED10-310 bacterium]